MSLISWAALGSATCFVRAVPLKANSLCSPFWESYSGKSESEIDAADHGSPWNDDALVPFAVQAKGFRLRGEAVSRATQVAPTIAALLETAPPAAALHLPAIGRE